MGVTFKVAAQSKEDMKPLYQKLNYLVSNTAPEYLGSGRMATPFVRLTVGDYFDRVPGLITTISLKWNKNYPWETGNPGRGFTSDVRILPHVLDVSVGFQPIHNFLPQKSIEKSQFIGIGKNWAVGTTTTASEGVRYTYQYFTKEITATDWIEVQPGTTAGDAVIALFAGEEDAEGEQRIISPPGDSYEYKRFGTKVQD